METPLPRLTLEQTINEFGRINTPDSISPTMVSNILIKLLEQHYSDLKSSTESIDQLMEQLKTSLTEELDKKLPADSPKAIQTVRLSWFESMAGPQMRQLAREGARIFRVLNDSDAEIGLSLIFTDNMTHQITQILITNFIIEAGAITNAHLDNSFRIAVRFYNIGMAGEPENAPEKYTWGQWSDILSTDTVAQLVSLEKQVPLLAKQINEATSAINVINTKVAGIEEKLNQTPVVAFFDILPESTQLHKNMPAVWWRESTCTFVWVDDNADIHPTWTVPAGQNSEYSGASAYGNIVLDFSDLPSPKDPLQSESGLSVGETPLSSASSEPLEVEAATQSESGLSAGEALLSSASSEPLEVNPAAVNSAAGMRPSAARLFWSVFQKILYRYDPSTATLVPTANP